MRAVQVKTAAIWAALVRWVCPPLFEHPIMIPKQFELAAHTWTVEPMHGPFLEGEDLCNGICDFATLTIRVNVDMPASLVMHSFLHEVMHAALWSIGHELSTDEHFVDALGCILAQMVLTAKGCVNS